VAYGAVGSFLYKTVTGPVTCTNAAMGGDALAGEVKACYVRTGGPNGFTAQCAGEGGICALPGRQTVAYGANGSYVYKVLDPGAACTTQTFGTDPISGVLKACFS
jgi:hypothetical protein